jgi:hypothetical protein
MAAAGSPDLFEAFGSFATLGMNSFVFLEYVAFTMLILFAFLSIERGGVRLESKGESSQLSYRCFVSYSYSLSSESIPIGREMYQGSRQTGIFHMLKKIRLTISVLGSVASTPHSASEPRNTRIRTPVGRRGFRLGGIFVCVTSNFHVWVVLSCDAGL